MPDSRDDDSISPDHVRPQLGLSRLRRRHCANVFSVGGFEVTRSELGAAANYRFIPRSDCYWLVMAFLPAVAWLANALRVVALTAEALVTNTEFVSPSSHTMSASLSFL